MLEAGVAREVARIVLPLTIYSSMYVTMNARSLMNFLSLRTAREDAHFPSFPQREIEMCAEKMEEIWAGLMPLTHAAFEAQRPGRALTARAPARVRATPCDGRDPGVAPRRSTPGSPGWLTRSPAP